MIHRSLFVVRIVSAQPRLFSSGALGILITAALGLLLTVVTLLVLQPDFGQTMLIALVWGGFYVMMAGGFLAFLKRAREARHATLLAEAKATVPPREAVASTGPAIPVHGRSRL